MKVKLLVILVVLLLAGCNVTHSYLPSGTKAKSMTIVDKEVREVSCVRGCTYAYYVTLEKNEQKIELQLRDERIFTMIQMGTVVTVTYDKDFYIDTWSFDDIETERDAE